MSTVVFDRWGGVVRRVHEHRDRRDDGRLRVDPLATHRHEDHLLEDRQAEAAAVGGAIGAVVCSPPYAIAASAS